MTSTVQPKKRKLVFEPCTECHCALNILKVQTRHSASPSVQLIAEDVETGKKCFVKCFINPEAIKMEKVRRFIHGQRALQYELDVYRHIKTHFQGNARDSVVHSASFVQLAKADCDFANIKELWLAYRKECKICAHKTYTAIAEALVTTLCPPGMTCPLNEEELHVFISKIGIKAIVTELCSNSVTWSQLWTLEMANADRIRLMCDVLRISQYCHKRLELYHLDLHGDNLLLCEENGSWRPKFFDWDYSLCYALSQPNPNHRSRWKKNTLTVEESTLCDRAYLLNLVVNFIRRYRIEMTRRYNTSQSESRGIFMYVATKIFPGQDENFFIQLYAHYRSRQGGYFAPSVITNEYFKDRDFKVRQTPMNIDGIDFEAVIANPEIEPEQTAVTFAPVQSTDSDATIDESWDVSQDSMSTERTISFAPVQSTDSDATMDESWDVNQDSMSTERTISFAPVQSTDSDATMDESWDVSQDSMSTERTISEVLPIQFG